MEVSYKKLWKILIDKDMKKKDLQAAVGRNKALKRRNGQPGSVDEDLQSPRLRYWRYHGANSRGG